MNKKVKSVMSWIGFFLFTFLCTMFIQSEVFAGVTVDQNSMNNTLFPNDKMFVNKLSYHFAEPKRGDIIVFLKNEEKGNVITGMKRNIELFANKFLKNEEVEVKYESLVKRVIGVPGDVVDIKDGNVYINNEMLSEDYAKGYTYDNGIATPITVGENQLFVLGDNREVSEDSRNFGLISYDQIEGKAVFRLYPFQKMGTLK